jgi:hypothetical protein
MSIKTFWTMLIKILGIWLILRFFSVSSSMFLLVPCETPSAQDILGIIVSIVSILAIYGIILWLFVFKSSWLIDKLRLDKGFTEEKIDLNVQCSTVLTIAVIIIGGIMLIDSVPELCRQIFIFIKQKYSYIESPAFSQIIFTGVKALIGFLLMTNSRTVVNFIDKETIKEQEKIE